MSFRRALGPFDATMLVIGAIIGAGIFINPFIVAQRLDSGFLVLTAWIAGGAIAMAGAFAFAELGSLFPQAGGHYASLRDAYPAGPATSSANRPETPLVAIAGSCLAEQRGTNRAGSATALQSRAGERSRGPVPPGG